MERALNNCERARASLPTNNIVLILLRYFLSRCLFIFFFYLLFSLFFLLLVVYLFCRLSSPVSHFRDTQCSIADEKFHHDKEYSLTRLLINYVERYNDERKIFLVEIKITCFTCLCFHCY